MIRLLAPVAAMLLSAFGPDPTGNDKLKGAPPNTWIKLTEETTGGRSWPMFHFDPKLGEFVLSGGATRGTAHFDTEFFDAGAGTWSNAYPAGAPYSKVTGPTDAPGLEFREDHPPLKADAKGVTRILRGLNPYCRDPGVFHQSAYCPDDGTFTAYLQDRTLAFDSKSRQWSDLKVPGFGQVHDFSSIYGALAYDPINKEVVSTGGTSDEDGGTPGTWVFKVGSNAWKKLSHGSKELKGFNAEAKALHEKTAAFINACRNRLYWTENEAEVRRNLSAGASETAAEIAKLAEKLKSAKVARPEAQGIARAEAALARASAGLASMAGKLNATPTGEMLVEAQALQDSVKSAERALDLEPCGRAASPAVSCGATGKIVLFGGCRMDGYLADTWVYDCKSRTWEQRYPKVSPAPRAGHILAWLPKAKKVVLYGAVPFSSPYGVPHGNASPPQDLWTYDVETNEWRLLAAPGKEGPLSYVGAVNDQDILVAVGRSSKHEEARVTWGMKIDPGAPVPVPGRERADAAPTPVHLAFDTPAEYDKVARPASEVPAGLLKDPPANQWTLMPAPPKKVNPHPWGTIPYDATRHQLLSFGGGHSSAHYNDVAHYSLRTATWSVGYAEEFPYANASFKAMFNQTFNNRPTVPTHVWAGAAFDEVSGKAVFCVRGGTWIYDPTTREWEYPPLWDKSGGTQITLKGTPRGVVCWGPSGELQILDVQKRAWSKLPLNGGKLPGAYCDTGGLCYDSKRDALWLAHDGSPMYCYDVKSGSVRTDSQTGAPENVSMRETAYIPELDMLLNAGRIAGPGGAVGNLAYDIASKKWVGIQLPCGDNQPRINDKPYSSISLSLHYDPKLKLAIFHSNTQEILVTRFERASLKIFDVKRQQPKK